MLRTTTVAAPVTIWTLPVWPALDFALQQPRIVAIGHQQGPRGQPEDGQTGFLAQQAHDSCSFALVTCESNVCVCLDGARRLEVANQSPVRQP